MVAFPVDFSSKYQGFHSEFRCWRSKGTSWGKLHMCENSEYRLYATFCIIASPLVDKRPASPGSCIGTEGIDGFCLEELADGPTEGPATKSPAIHLLFEGFRLKKLRNPF